MNSIAILEAVNTTAVQFHGQPIITAMVAGVAYVAMKPIVENIGINWKGQHVKLVNQMDKFGCGDISIPTKGGIQKMLCIPLRKLNGWLFSINPEKVRADIRDKLIQYQEECFTVLHDYWVKGEASNPRKVKTLPGKISKDQQAAIKELVMSRGQVLPKEKQAKAMITMWSALKTHFGITYKEIEEGQFTEALSLVARLPLDGEFIGRQEAVSVVEKQFTDDEICSLAWLWLLADKMQQHASLTYPALKQLESRYAGEAHDLAKEFKYWLGQTMSILSRESARIEPSEKFACIDALNHLKDNQWKAALLAKH